VEICLNQKVSFFNLQEVKTPNLTHLQVFQKNLSKNDYDGLYSSGHLYE